MILTYLSAPDRGLGREWKGANMARDLVAEIRRATRKRFRAEYKIRSVLEGLRGEIPVTHLCRREGISPARQVD